MISTEHTPLPWEVVPGDEHHGPYITDAFGTTVCDLYVMTDPAVGNRKPVTFTDGEENAPLIVEAVNSHASLLAENEKLREAVKPFLDVLDNDVGQDEADADFFRPMNTHNRAERLRVGHFRALRAALGEPQ